MVVGLQKLCTSIDWIDLPAGKISFDADNGLAFVCWLNDEGAKPTAGYGGWTVIQRPHRLSITQWDGRDPLQMEIALLFDGYADNDPIENECQILEKMAFHDEDKHDPPPIITIDGDFVPHTGLKYVINGITWGTAIRRMRDGKRVRQEATVTIIRHNAADKLQLKAAAKARKKHKKKVKHK